MADFNRHLKKSKILVFFTIFAFLYMPCFTSCSKSNNQGKIATARKTDQVEKSEKSEAPKVETAGNLITAESDNTTQSDKSDDPCAGCPPGVDASAENAEQKKPLTQEELNQKADMLDRYFQALEEAAKEIPRETYDPQSIVDLVGKDPEALFKWVRDNTCLLPYQGVLRGPIGVLMDRFGNSLDRALLLYELLRLAGLDVRLAHGTLSEKLARESFNNDLGRAKKLNFVSREFSTREIDAFIQENNKKYHIEQDELRKTIDQLIKEHQDLSLGLEERTNSQAAFIVKAIEKYRQKEDRTSIDFDSLKEHWWVQAKKEGLWFDLDPDHPDGEAGATICEVNKTCQPSDISNDSFHKVKVRVIIEQWTPESHNEKTVLEYDLTPANLFEKRVALGHLPLDWEKTFDALEKPDPLESLKLHLLTEKEWVPILSVGSEHFYKSGFNDEGEILESPLKKTGRRGAGVISGGLLGGLAGRESDKKTESFLTAEWIEYEISSPGIPPIRVRRQIFDFIGPTARQLDKIPSPDISESTRFSRCLSILSGREILIQVCHLSPAFILHLEAKNLMANRDILLNSIRQDNPLNLKEIIEKAQKLAPLPGLEFGFAYARHDLSKYKNAIYLDRPNIINLTHGVRQNLKGEIHAFSAFDIVTNAVSVYPIVKEDAFFVNLYQGVLDTNAEALLIGSSGRTAENTSEIFAQSESLGIKWLTIRGADSQEWREVNLPKDVRTQLEENLREGYIVVVPQKSISKDGRELSGWWRVDPKSGSVLGLGPDGRGQALTEYEKINTETAEKILLGLHLFGNILCWWAFLMSKSLGSFVARLLLCLTMAGYSLALHVAVSGGQAGFGFIFFGIPLWTMDRLLHVLGGL